MNLQNLDFNHAQNKHNIKNHESLHLKKSQQTDQRLYD